MQNARPLIARMQWLQLFLMTACVALGSLSFHGGQISISSYPFAANRPYTFPVGNRSLFPGYRLVALYGSPGEPGLGVLGQQSLPATIARVKDLAKNYQPFMKEYALPTLEIIATVASASPTTQGTYSREVSTDMLGSWVHAARQNGVYVVLDLQPGRSDFLSQAKRYKGLLREPNVGLALDPEWRLAPNQLPLQQIGTVGIDEINQTIQWLTALTDRYRLPQKLLLLHAFRLSMISNRDQLDTTHSELEYVIQMDGEGTQTEKMATWTTIIGNPPNGVHFGWKNFYSHDMPLRTPSDTMQLSPKPWYVSYQ